MQRMLCRPYLGKARVHKPVQTPSKDLVTHEDGEVEVSDSERASEVPCIRPMTRDGETEHDHVD